MSHGAMSVTTPLRAEAKRSWLCNELHKRELFQSRASTSGHTDFSQSC